MNDRRTYLGSCHCSRVSFEVDARLDHVTACSCSLCRRLGALWHAVPDANLRLTSGEADLTLYRFNPIATAATEPT